MRFGKWRGLAVVCALSAMLVLGRGGSAHAGWFHNLPGEVEAVDVNTGGPYMAPPVPYGHYAKAGHGGKLGGLCGGMLCRLCGGAGCGACGGKGCGLFGGNGCGLCGGKGCGGCADPGAGCGACGGKGCGFCSGKGLLHRLGSRGCGGQTVAACPVVQPAMQVTMPSAQAAPSAQTVCGTAGCNLGTRHAHRLGRGCNMCSGQGCGVCQGGGMATGDLCGSCRGSGCGLCGGRGLFAKHRGNGCGACGGKGCGACGGLGNGCGACGGKGCGLCGGGHGLGLMRGLAAKALHKGEIKYFMGAGGPVPITPGYVPYVVTTRSPRDFFAFPPFTDVLP